MLEALRKSTGSWVAKVLIGLLVLSFAVWGVADIFGGYGTQTVATVGDTEIPAEQYQQELQREISNLSRRLGRNITFDDAQRMGLDNRVLLRLIGDAAVENQANTLGLGISPEAVSAYVTREDIFKDQSGNFSREQFYRVLLANNLSEQAFLLRQQRALVLEQITETVGRTGQVPKTLIDAVNKFRNETRQINYVTVSLDKLGTVAEPSDEQIKEYYNAHKSEFRAPEYRKVGLIVMTPDSLAETVEVSEEDQKAYFESNKSRFGQPERRHVQQIPFPDEQTADAAYKRLKEGADFMDIAKERDLTKGDVDLGVIPKTQLADEKVADAIFALPVDQISEPIKGDLATVIAKVTKIEPAVVKTFEDEKENIRKFLAAQRAAESILDSYDKIEDERATGATLAEVAKKLNLKFVEVEAVDARGRDKDGKPVELFAKEPRVLQAIFAADAKVETDPEETSDRGYTWYEVEEIVPQRQKDLSEVKKEAAEKWRENEERTILVKKGQELVDKLRGGEPLAKLAEEFGVEEKKTEPIKRSSRDAGLPPAAVQQAFALKEGQFGSASTQDGKNRVLFQVAEVKVPKAPDAKAQEALLKSAETEVGDDLIVQYIRALRDKFGVSINDAVFQQARSGQYAAGGQRGSF
ncbi:MAG: SurA N-terminal domain-containing protein [Hyphomicrobiaceae bacterium]|nr:SurA N-terminal domain-containing protein [Hyphomicrobiaceae bacterium]